MDAEETILYCNPAFSEIFETTVKDITGENLLSFFSDEDRQKILDETQKRKKGESSEYDLNLITSRGTKKIIQVHIAPRHNDQGKYTGAVGLISDISHEKQLMENYIRSNQDLEQFAYVVSHDLQEPLRMVSSYLGLLQKRYAGQLDDDADTFINYSVDGAERMSKMIKGLIRFSRINTRGNPFIESDCSYALEQALNNLNLLIEENHAVIKAGTLPVLPMDHIQITQLFQNLISNAIKFSGDNTPHIQIDVENQVDMWKFSIKDNGIGIAEENQSNIFNVFQRLYAARNIEGTGIGLAICRRIVERHQGRIWVESGPGAGTTFYFTLPKVRSELRDQPFFHPAPK